MRRTRARRFGRAHGGWANRRGEYESHVLVPSCRDLERGLDAGRRMTLEEAVAYALDE